MKKPGDTMKTKKRVYVTMVNCPANRKLRIYEIRNRRSDRAWLKGCAKFFAEFPKVLERGLTVGGEVVSLRRGLAEIHKAN